MVAFNFQKEFAAAILSGDKRQTIRRTMRCKPGAGLQLYTGMRTKTCTKITDAVCTDVWPIILHPHSVEAGGGWIRADEDLDKFARADGFADFIEMIAWFDRVHGLPFEGWLHQWIPSDKCNEGKE